MKLRIILVSLLIIIVATGVTFHQLSNRVHHAAISVPGTTTSLAPPSTTSIPQTSTSIEHTTTSHPNVTTTYLGNPVPVINPPVVFGGSGHIRTDCPLTSPFNNSAPSTTTSTVVAPTTTSTEISPSTTTSTSTTTTTRPSTRFCTIMQVGDSLGYGRGHAMASRLAGNNWLRFYIDDRGSTGLSNQPYFDWVNRIRNDLNQYHPNLLIVSFGGNDAQQLTGDGSAEAFGTARWKSLYASRVHQILAMAAAKHCGVLWLGMPISEMYLYNQAQLVINQIYAREVATSTDSVFIPLWNVLTKHQQFVWTARVNGMPVTLRSQDGIHPSPWGYAVEATYVINHMKSIYHVDLQMSSAAYITGY